MWKGMAVNISDDGIALLKRLEGYRSHAYQDSADVWTVGYGTTGSDIGPGTVVTEDEAERMLEDGLAWAEDAVNELIQINLTQSQFDALTIFVYNVGHGAFLDSDLRQCVNAGQHAFVPREMCRWVYAGGSPLIGLARRRVAVASLYLED